MDKDFITKFIRRAIELIIVVVFLLALVSSLYVCYCGDLRNATVLIGHDDR